MRDPIAARELVLFVENDADLYRQQRQPIEKNLAKKWDKGLYCHEKAPKLWLSLMTAGAMKYTREFGTPGEPYHKLFHVETRREAAQQMADDYLEELKLRGELGHANN